MLPFDDEQNRTLANLRTYYDQWIAAARELDGPYKGSMRWKVVSNKQYLYHRISANPLVDISIGRRSPETESRMVAFQQGKASASARGMPAFCGSAPVFT